jgi:alpha-galactosidase
MAISGTTDMTKEVKGASSRVAASTDAQPLDLKIGYIGGGSRGWAHALMKDLAACSHFNGEVRLYDIDRETAGFNADYGNWLQTSEGAVSRWKYRAVNSLEACVKGADFVFCSIQPGPIQLMKVDLMEPMKYGIYQPVGDTVGPGGCIRALRAIKDYRSFAAAIAEHAPTAWVINFTNPMTLCTRTLFEEFPAIKAFGCCHEVFGTQRMFGKLYARAIGQPAPGREDISVNVLGINHFTWIDQAACHGVDLMALLDENIRHGKLLRRFTEKSMAKVDGKHITRHQVAFELYRRFGVLAAAGDRHLAEFVPWFLTGKDSCYRWGFRLTPYALRLRRFNRGHRDYAKVMKSGVHPAFADSGEEYINQMLALVGKTTFRTNVNLPNSGQMGKTPLGAVVETNALFSRDCVEPIASGALPDNVNALVGRHILNQESLLKAVYERDSDLAFQAFACDPLVGRLGMDDAWKLFNAMVKKTGFEF